ncbi:MAG: hypothetical protein ACJ8FY_01975 [Gemmataceae bacterium]
MPIQDSSPNAAPSPAQSNAPVTAHTFWWKVWQVAKVVQARLRFIVILMVIGVLIASWDNLNNFYEKWTRPLYGTESLTSGDFEYYCP